MDGKHPEPGNRFEPAAAHHPPRRTARIAAAVLAVLCAFASALAGSPAGADEDASLVAAGGQVASGAPAQDGAGMSADMSYEGRAADMGGVPVYYYTGQPITPIASVRDAAGSKLDEGSYLIKYLNNRNAGTGTAASTAAALVVRSGGGGRDGCRVLFKIRKADLSDPADVEVGLEGGDGGKLWMPGARPRPVVRSVATGKELAYGDGDLTISYSGESERGATAKVVVEASGDKSRFVGRREVEYKILGTDTAPSLSIAPIADQIATGVEIRPALAVTYVPGDGKPGKLLDAKDYTASFSGNSAPGTATVKVEGKGAYAGLSATATFKVSAAVPETPGTSAVDLSSASAKPIASKVFSGSAIALSPGEVVLTANGKQLVAGKDYSPDFKYAGNVHAGTASVTVKGKGGYKGSKKITFAIKPAPLSKAHVNPIPAQAYAKKAISPSIKVTYGKAQLKNGRDFSVTFSNNKSIGKATGTIVGRGDYTGSRRVSFKIADETKISLDKKIMMIDTEHYDRFFLTAKLSGSTSYKAKDIRWKIVCKKPYVNAASFSSKKACVSRRGGTVKGSGGQSATVTVWGRRWSGNEPIEVTTSLPDATTGKLKVFARCKLKVVSCGMADSDVGEIPGGNTHKTCNDVYHGDPITWEGKTFYLTEPASKRKGNFLATKSYGEKYVAAYINNAQALVRRYPKSARFSEEYKKKTYTCSKQSGLKISWDEKRKQMSVSPQHAAGGYDVTRKVKAKGELSATNYLFFVSNKNQWEYLLKKDSKGVWSCIASKRASTAHSNHAFDPDWAIRVIGWNTHGMGLVASHYPDENGRSDVSGAGNFIHLQNNSHVGTPGTEGCTMVGKFGDKIYYQLMAKAGLGTRVIIY